MPVWNGMSAIVLAVELALPFAAKAFDESKYPDMQGQWSRPLGIGIQAHCASMGITAGGNACSPVITGIGAESGHHVHRSPSTRLPTLASGWRSIVRMSIARLDRQPGQCTSSHGMPAITAQRIVGDHSPTRPAASAAFHRSTTRTASSRETCSAARARW
jgi:hypothetical protein